MNETVKDALNDLKRVGVAAIFFGLGVALGLTESWLMIPGFAALGFVGGLLAAKGRREAQGRKVSWKDGATWGVIGLIAGLGFYFFGV